jgi:hypothetical protein
MALTLLGNAAASISCYLVAMDHRILASVVRQTLAALRQCSSRALEGCGNVSVTLRSNGKPHPRNIEAAASCPGAT